MFCSVSFGEKKQIFPKTLISINQTFVWKKKVPGMLGKTYNIKNNVIISVLIHCIFFAVFVIVQSFLITKLELEEPTD